MTRAGRKRGPAARESARAQASAIAGFRGAPPRAVTLIGGLVAMTVFLVGFARLWGYVLDDTYISLRYAQHLAQGQGLVYNPGERVEGYSNFLWTVLLALPHALRIPPVPFLKVVLALTALATAWATVRLGRAAGLTSDDGREAGWMAWVPGWLFLLTPLVIERTADGLETLPFTLLLVLATTVSLDAGRPGRAVSLGLALLGLAMMRPEGAMFAPLLLGIAALRGARGATLRAGLVFIVPFALFMVARHAYYGDWLPNTFYAKRGSSAMLQLGWKGLLGFLTWNGGWAWLIALPALALPRTRVAGWLLISVVATRVAFHLWSGGEWIGRGRFLLPILPFLHLLFVAAIAALPARGLRPWAVAAAGLLLLAPAWLRYRTGEAENLTYASGLNAAHGALGRDVAAGTAPDALIAMDDAGLGPYLARRRNLDMLGLNDRHIARLPGYFTYKVDVAYVLERSPDLIVLVSSVAEPTRTDQLPLAMHAALASDSTFHARYGLLRVYTMRADYHLGVFQRRDTRAVLPNF